MGKYNVIRDDQEYVVKVSFYGDSITPLYKFKVYRPRKNWFNKLIYVEKIHRDKIQSMSQSAEKVVDSYLGVLKLWD